MIIKTENLTKKYKDKTVVDNVSIHVEKGKIYGLIGRNGAGKTTTMKMIMGITSVTEGNIELFDMPIQEKKHWNIYPRIGSIIEIPGFYPNLTGTENLEVFAKIRGVIGKNAVKESLDLMGLPYKDKKPFSKYSLGMKQRLGIANALMHDPELLILDEPTNGLDPIGITEMRTFIQRLAKEAGKTILISSHILSEITLLADDIGILHNGRLLEESSMQKLEEKNRKYISIEIESAGHAAYVLEHQLHIADFEVISDHYIHIYEEMDSAVLNKNLVKADVPIFSLQSRKSSLEDYFVEITGGNGIA